MAHQMLSEIHNHSRKWVVSVLVSRLWFYRGGTDNGPIQHMDLVVLDSQVCLYIASSTPTVHIWPRIPF